MRDEPKQRQVEELSSIIERVILCGHMKIGWYGVRIRVAAYCIHSDQARIGGKVDFITGIKGSVQDRLAADCLLEELILGDMIPVNLPAQDGRNSHMRIREHAHVFFEKYKTFERRRKALSVFTIVDDFLEHIGLKSVEYDVQYVFLGGKPVNLP